MKVSLPASVSSLQDARSLQLEMRDYARWFSHNAIKKRVGAGRAAEAPALSAAATELMRNWHSTAPLTQHSLDTYLADLESCISNAPQLTITLAAPPTTGLKATLVAWCRSNIAPNVLVSFQFNATLLGGMVVRYGSHIFDWSFRHQILEARQRFPEVLRNV